jgi:hypothetical protein
MARGFESKGSQEYAGEQTLTRKPRLSAEAVAAVKKREELELTRSRLRHELEETTSDMRRRSLTAALQHIEGEIGKL